MKNQSTVIKTEAGTMTLLPAKEGTCAVCATAHEPTDPHNAQSLFYQVKFKMEHGREASWIDATAHCTDELRAHWRTELMSMGIDFDGGQVSPKHKYKAAK